MSKIIKNSASAEAIKAISELDTAADQYLKTIDKTRAAEVAQVDEEAYTVLDRISDRFLNWATTSLLGALVTLAGFLTVVIVIVAWVR